MSKATLTVAKTTDAEKRLGVLLSLSIQNIGENYDTLLEWSSVLDESWIGLRNRRHAEFELWAKTEYKNDWEFAYNHMLANNGEKPRIDYLPKKEAA